MNNTSYIAAPISGSITNLYLTALTSSAVQDTGVSDPSIPKNIAFTSDVAWYASFAAGTPTLALSGTLTSLTGTLAGPFPIGLTTLFVDTTSRYFKAVVSTTGTLKFWNATGNRRTDG